MTTLISSFSHYAGRAADRMGVPEDETLVRACVELMFNVMFEHEAPAISNPLEKNRYVAEKTAEWILPRYEAYKKYAPDFLKDRPAADHDAVIVAMLCTGYTHWAHVPANGNDPDSPTVFKNDSIDLEIIERADDLIDEAEILVRKVTGGEDLGEEDGDEPSLEAIYLAHGFLGDLLYQGDNAGYDECSHGDLQHIKDNLLSPIRAFVHAYTIIGREITHHIDYIEAYFATLSEPEQKPAPRHERPILTLIQNTQPTP